MASGCSSHPAARRDVLHGALSWAEDDCMQNVLLLCIAQCAPSEVCVGMPKVWLQSITLAHSNCLNIIKEHH